MQLLRPQVENWPLGKVFHLSLAQASTFFFPPSLHPDCCSPLIIHLQNKNKKKEQRRYKYRTFVHRLSRLYTSTRGGERGSCYATIISHFLVTGPVLTHITSRDSMTAVWPCSRAHPGKKTQNMVAGEGQASVFTRDDLAHYRVASALMLPAGTQPSTLAASASHAPAARLGDPPRKQTSRWRGHTDTPARFDPPPPSFFYFLFGCYCKSGVEIPFVRGAQRPMDVLVFSALRRRERWKTVGILRRVPSLSAFLNPPTLRPSPSQARSLSRRPPPALCQTAALAVFLINLFIFAAR